VLAIVQDKKSTMSPIQNTIAKEEKPSPLGDKGTCACSAEEKKSQHADEGEVQYKITFEDYLHNTIYYKRPSASNRRKREIVNYSPLSSNLHSSFDSVKDDPDLVFPPAFNPGPATPQPADEPDNKMENGKYVYFRIKVTDPIYVFKQLKHFGGYSISVAACRAQVPNESNQISCSTVSMVTARTGRLGKSSNDGLFQFVGMRF